MKHQTRFYLGWILAAGLFLFAARPSLAQQYNNRNFSGGRGGSSYSSANSKPADGGKMPGTATIEYDPDTGSIIVFTDEETNRHIQKVIEGMDQPVPQVLIKVLFLEVTHTDKKDLGVEGILKFDHGKDVNELTSAFGLATETQGGFYKIIDSDLEATIRAIAEKTKLEVLSRPSVLTRNNQEATIMVGQEVPFITRSSLTDNGQTINSIQYSDIGIILRVTPHIAPERMVEMQIDPEISTLTAESVPIGNNATAPVIDKRSADTRVLVGNGKTVVIGGMMGNNKKEKVQKIPLLGDIPYAGALFRRTVKEKTKTELLIFLTPLVVENPKELQAVSKAENRNSPLVHEAFTPEEMKQYFNPVPQEIRKAK